MNALADLGHGKQALRSCPKPTVGAPHHGASVATFKAGDHVLIS